ncbi:MAG TPA: hypothetical protein VF230_09555 [Acidimicrobiales bacterium]
MPRRIEVELTSSRADGTWTWRAAGAREPKGVVESSVLYEGAKVGDVLKAEVEMDVDGITITSVQPPKGKTPAAPNRIEIVGPARDFEAVTTSLVPKHERPRGDRRDRGDRGDRGDRPPRPGGDRGARGAGPRGTGERGERPSGDRGPRPDRGARTGDARGPRPDRGGDRRPGGQRTGAPQEPAKPRPKRLNPASTHRNAVVETLSPEQKPIAEQLLRGGIPAVRRAIEEQNTAARAEGHPEIKAEALLAAAEDLLPRLKTAEWHDRAEAAMADVDTLGLRDLRSVVSGADANARDDETRKLAGTLREALDRRLTEERDEWTKSITTALDESRLVRALRLATRPPDPSMRLSSDLAKRLSTAASEQLSPDTAPDRWSALLEAVVASPVRTTVKPVGLPAEPPPSLVQAAQQAAGRIPALAQLLGLAIPPPPMAPKGGARPSRGARPIPPPPRPPTPPAPAAPVPDAPTEATHEQPIMTEQVVAEPEPPAAPVPPAAPEASVPPVDAEAVEQPE